MIILTDPAVAELKTLLAERGDAEEGCGLRIFVEKGGCSGLEYGMKFAPPEPGDATIERDGARVFIDAASADYLRGCTIDFHDGLTGAGFRIHNPNAVRTCGCGSSFEPAPVNAAATEAH
ncbi:MAG: iron-sulfur cluster assembly accessory protein [Verrucomicrobia bacterium]|nr:iron-sulfur cluster assembly accessory protein [Verrucomicrobiota bacterium]MBV9658628.1 iron-sulfur cluster assembly accessory protein [Verrucomicrobiota bacterium]